MKANLFALFCITLFVLSVPQAFAEDTNSTVTAEPTVEQNPTTEVPPTSVEEQPAVVSEPTETVTKAPEPAPVENSADEEVAEKSVAAADTETNKAEDDAEKVQTVEPVDAPVDPEAGSEGEQDSTEQVAAPSGEENTAAPAGEDKTTEENTAATAEPENPTEANETEETPETPAAVPTEAPGSNNATNTEPSAPVSSPEENQEAAPAAEDSQETAPTAEENQETAPAAEQLEKKDGLSFFGLISKILVGLGLLSVVILVGCVYHYRYQMQKYKIAPFTPPSFLPECLFPRNTESSGRLISGYTELQVGNYQSAPRFAEI